MERATNNQYLLREEITDNIIIIKINRSYRRGMSPEELYDITRGCWKRRIASVDHAEFALAVYEGEVVEVYRIFAWYSSFDEMMNDPIFKMMCGEDEDDTESVEETSHS